MTGRFLKVLGLVQQVPTHRNFSRYPVVPVSQHDLLDKELDPTPDLSDEAVRLILSNATSDFFRDHQI